MGGRRDIYKLKHFIINFLPIFLIIYVQVLYSGNSYEILNFPENAQSLSLNNIMPINDSQMLQKNPATISLNSKGIRYSYAYLPADIHFASIQNFKKKYNWINASKISFLNYGKIIDSNTENESSAFDLMVEYAYKKEIRDITSLGISIGYIFSSISGYNSQLIFSRIGIRSRLFNNNLGIGISMENFGFILDSYTKHKEPMPTLIRNAIYYKTKYLPLIINVNFINNINEDTFSFLGGLELTPRKFIVLRLGISSNRINLKTDKFFSDILVGISGGIGFHFKHRIIDLGFMNIGPAGFILGISIINKN